MADFTKIHPIELSLSTLRRLCKSHGLSWKRIRRSLNSKRDTEEFERSK